MNIFYKLIRVQAVFGLLFLLPGCQSESASESLFAASSPLAGFRSAVMSRDGKGEQVTTVFSSSDAAIHTVMKFNPGAKGVKVTCVTIVVNAGNLRNAHTPAVQRVVEQPEYGMDCIADRPSGGWPIGTYRTEIYLGDELARRLPWEVR